MKTSVLLSGVLCVAVLYGCDKSQQDQAQSEVTKGAQSAWDKTKDMASKGWDAAQKTAGQISETSKIKTQIGKSDVDTSTVSVETIGGTVYLIGNVPTQDQKDKAEKIAKDIADKGYTIEDDLKIGPAKEPAKEPDKEPSKTST